MLALLFRGVFLVGVIGWYSASLWKAVDHYFKGQFQRYLEEEYQRNPRMRDDVRAYTTTTADKAASDVIADTRLAEIACSSGDADGENVCPIDKADLLGGALREVKSQEISVPGDFGAGAAEIEVARPSAAHTDQRPAFRDSPVDEAVPPLQIPSPPPPPPPSSSPKAIRDYKIDESSNLGEIEQAAEKIPALKQKQQRKVEEEEEEEVPKKDEKQSSPRVQKSTKARKKPNIEAKSEVVTKRKIKEGPKIKILKLTEEDFEEVARFHEFDYEDDGNRDFLDNFEDDNEDFTGIPLKDLPFKPMIDVYDLERVSEDEYCPLSLDDDPTCDELRSWP